MIGGCGLLTGAAAVQRPFELVVLAAEGSLVAPPHLQADLQRLLEPLESLGEGRERDAKAARLLLVPRRADAQPGPTAREHVKRRDDLGQDARVPVDGAGDQGQQPGPGGAGGQVAKRRVGLEHVLLRRADHGDLEEMVHHADAVEAGLVCGPRDGRELAAELVGRARAVEVRDLQANSHVCHLADDSLPQPPGQAVLFTHTPDYPVSCESLDLSLA